MGIGSDVKELGEKSGLELLATGGGFDFLIKVNKKISDQSCFCPHFVISGRGSNGEQIPALNSPASIIVYPDFDWAHFCEFEIDTAEKAIELLTKKDFLASALNIALEAFPEDTQRHLKANSFIYFPFTREQSDVYEDHGMPYSSISLNAMDKYQVKKWNFGPPK